MIRTSPRTSDRISPSPQKRAPKLGIASTRKAANRSARSPIEEAATTSSQSAFSSVDIFAGAGCNTTTEVGPDNTTQSPGV